MGFIVPQWSRLGMSRNSTGDNALRTTRLDASMEPARNEPEQGPLPRRGDRRTESPQWSRLGMSRNRPLSAVRRTRQACASMEPARDEPEQLVEPDAELAELQPQWSRLGM